MPRRGKRQKMLKFDRIFCKNGDAYNTVEWGLRDLSLSGKDGKIIWAQRRVEMPTHWAERPCFIAANKYFRGQIGRPDREYSLKQLFDRIVNTITQAGIKNGYFDEKNGKIFANEIKWLLLHQRGAFNSPVFFNVGAVPDPQGSACFILTVEDNLESILDLQKAEALIFAQGSGSGTNLSKLRSSGEPLSKGGRASGPLSFMKAYDAWAGVIRSGGVQRRASKMMRLDDGHPDVWYGDDTGMDFITFKSREEKKALALIEGGFSGEFGGEVSESIKGQNCNLSVGISDEFMQAVINDGKWKLKEVLSGRTVKEFKASDMLDAIATAAHRCGDPGMQFDDRINEWHTCPKSGRINGTNPCGEFAFIDDSACNLASINLAYFMATPERIFYDEEFMAAVRLFIVAQDILVDMCSYPSQKITTNSRKFRPLGLGYCNLGGMLMSMGLPYDSTEGRLWASIITALMTGQAYLTSAEIASVLGPFSEFQSNKRHVLRVVRKHRAAVDNLSAIRQGNDVTALVEQAQQVWGQVTATVSDTGTRNAQVTLVAPTGTIAHMMGAATQGVEPELKLAQEKDLDAGGTLYIMNNAVPLALESLGYAEEEKARILEALKENPNPETAGIKEHDLPVFDTSIPAPQGKRYISADGHLRMMAAVQPFISGAISKTVNLPRSASIKDVKDVFIAAWKLGLKSITIYRSGSKFTQPIRDEKRRGDKEPIKKPLPETRQGNVHKFSVMGMEGFIITGFYEDGTLAEVFFTMSTEGSTMNGIMAALGRSISAGLQRGIPIDVYIKQFLNMKFEPMGYTSSQTPMLKRCWSILDYAAKYLSNLTNPGVNPLDRKSEEIPTKLAPENHEDEFAPLYQVCVVCGNLAKKKGSCYECDHCDTRGSCN